jgi:dephospho-CoA kinase
MVIDSELPAEEAIPALIQEMEQASKVLQCEVSLVFPPPRLGMMGTLWEEMGYTRMAPEALLVRAWKEAARESMPPGTILLFKKLREDRVLRPI